MRKLRLVVRYGLGIVLCAAFALVGALSLVFGVFQMEGYAVIMGVVALAFATYMFNEKAYDRYSLREVIYKLLA